MKPNWSAAAALARTLVLLFAATFVGALTLPVAADGSLPMDWVHWKPVLGTAFGLSVVAEVMYVRLHLSQLAQAAGLPVPSVSTAAKVATQSLMAIAMLLVFGALMACKALTAAAPSAVADVVCVVSDANKGDNISQIVLDCGGDTAQVISILADPANYAKTKGTPAYAEAGRAKVALAGLQ